MEVVVPQYGMSLIFPLANGPWPGCIGGGKFVPAYGTLSYFISPFPRGPWPGCIGGGKLGPDVGVGW